MSTRPRRLALLAALTLLAGFTAVIASSAPAAAADPLRTLAAAKGKFIGYAAATGPLANESAYRTIAAREFNQVTAENSMKWDATEPNDNQYNFSGADQVVTFAQQNGQVVHGHTLVWHSQTPGWVQGLGASAMRTAMLDHIATVVGRYANNPTVQSWDVVNEVFDENGGFRTSFWYNTLGSGFIADAFRAARAADPDAKLCINDYNVEGVNAKSTAMYNLVSSLKSQGVPIDCVGFQSHLATQYAFPSQLTQNVARFAALGVQVRFTELDVRIPLPADTNEINTQNQYYTNIINACLASTACPGVTIWGFTDKYSWVPDTFPGEGQALIYDANYNPKADYTAVATALGAGSGGGSPTTFTSTVVNQAANSCMDVPNGSANNGVQLQIYSCWGGTNQNFTFVPVAGTTDQYNVRTVGGGCVDVSGASTADNAAVIQWTCHTGNNQRFRLQPVTISGTTNTFNLVAAHSGKCVAPSGNGTANATVLVQLPCSTATVRVWRVPGYTTGGGGGSGTLPSSFQWSSSGALIAPKSDATHTIAGIKDPSVVYYNGKWHVFASVANASGYGMVYLSFTDWSQAGTATHYYLDSSPIGAGYRAAPQIFYFAPQGLWYLVYQTGNASYSTNPDISNPNGWSAPRNFYSSMPQIIRDNIGNGYWVDMWVICDSANCYLFSSDDNGHLYRSDTTLANFPNGMTNTVIAAQDANRNNLFEASNVYQVQGSNQYLLIVEAIGSDGRRYFRSWTSTSINGTWTPLAATESNPFARANNVTFTGTAWTRDISHGEMIRAGYDQTLTISPCQMRYLYQGMDPNAGGDYNSLPWRLGLLTQTNSTC